MSWIKVMLSLVVILLYIPLVFMGANVFFSDYTGMDSYYQGYKDCNVLSPESSLYVQNQTCVDEQINEQRTYEESKNSYNGNKYIFIVILNLLVLLFALFISFDESVIIGLFLGSTLTSFFSTWFYFATQSKIGFGVLFVIFLVTIYFVTKKKRVFFFKESRR